MSDAATQNLVRLCQDTERAAQGALSWFRDFPDRVAAQRPVLEKEFRLAAVEARKLRVAAERPVAVGVYGLSQAGKSYLISTLARPAGRELTAELDRPRGFLADINPESDKEATGLVTRFTMRAEKGPDGFPVKLFSTLGPPIKIDIPKSLIVALFTAVDSGEKNQVALAAPKPAE